MSEVEKLKGEILASIRRAKDRIEQRQKLQDADAEFCDEMTATLRTMMTPVKKQHPS